LPRAAWGQEPPHDAKDDTWRNPAKGTDPPIWPSQPPEAPPTSISGTAVEPSAPPSAAVVVVNDPEAAAAQQRTLHALEERVDRSEQRVHTLERRLGVLEHLRLEAFVQPQLLIQSYNTAASPNLVNGQLPPGITANDTIAKSDGTTTNGTFFRVRRARLRTTYETDEMRLYIQIDGLPAGGVGPGVGTILRNAEATGIVHWNRDVRTELTAGLFQMPFRRELIETSLERPFIERTWFIQNVFPLERDYGAHAKTIMLDDRLVADVAIVNGQRLGESTFTALPDLNGSKDFVGYATYQVGWVTLGLSGYFGKGQIVDSQALRFKQYSRWAVNYEASVEHTFFEPAGETRLSSALTFARNMDSGVIYPFAVPQIPPDFFGSVSGHDERAFYVRVEQDIGRHATVGYRFDTYTPETDIATNARDTHAFLVAFKITPNLRWMNELDWAIDNVHDGRLPPPSKHIVSFSSVLQAMF
jgi:hypothetical protein